MRYPLNLWVRAVGEGERSDPRCDGWLMKAWVSIKPESEEEWLPLASV